MLARPTEEQLRGRTSSADQELADLAHALAHPARIQILRIMLSQGPGCFCGDLVKIVGLAQSTVSHHLKILREAGFITATGSGTAVCYCANRQMIRQMMSLLEGLGPLEDDEEE